MLLNLSTEVLINISILLTFEQKVDLMLTCHKMYDIISKNCLHETIDLPRNKDDEESIIRKFQINQLNGKQVKKLSIYLEQLSNQLYSKLPVIFPNVVELHNTGDDLLQRDDVVLNEFVKWKDSLKYLSSYHNVSHFYRLLEQNVFSSLVQLQISFNNFNNGSQTNCQTSVLRCIENSPKLEELELGTCKVTIDFLEKLHSSCSNLRSLCLNSLFIHTSDDILPEHLVPASGVLELSVYDVAICDSNCVFLRYITQKYTELEDLSFNAEFEEPDYSTFLLDSRDDDEDLNDPVFLLLENEFNTTRDVYFKTGVDILSNVSNALKILNLSTEIFDNIVNMFDQRKTHLTAINEIDDKLDRVIPKEPDQLRAFKNLTSLKSLTTAFNCSLQEYNYDIASISLTQLDTVILGTSHLDDMDLGWLLSIFPSLKYLKIECSGARLVCNESNPLKKYPNLARVSLGPGLKHPNLFNSICDIAPNIQEIRSIIFGIGIKKYTERSHGISNIIVDQDPPKKVNGQSCYEINLTGLYFGVFYLEIKLAKEMFRPEGSVFLELLNKGVPERFVLEDNFESVSRHVDFDNQKIKQMTKVSIKIDNMKAIIINNKVKIEPNEPNIQLGYWY